MRSMLDDPWLSYQRIGDKLRLSKQRIAQLADKFGVNVEQRLRDRRLTRPPSIIVEPYPPPIAAVINKIKHSGLQVLPYHIRQLSRENISRRSQRMVFVNGVLCAIQVQPPRKRRPRGRQYVRFDVGPETRRAKAAVFAMKKGRTRKLYLVPTTVLRNVSYVYIPADGKYAGGTARKPRRDWTRYENAWHLLWATLPTVAEDLR